jgi:hypothetical protein
MLKSDRYFQLWEYQVSHGMLLLRSPRSPEHQTNLDVLFHGVEYVFRLSSLMAWSS